MLNKLKSLATSALLKDSVIYVLGEMTTKAVPFLLLPYLTRVLGTAGFGELSYFMAVSSFVLIFISLSQNAALTRYYYVYGKNGLGNVLAAGGLYSMAVAVVGVLISIWQGSEGLFYAVMIALFQSLVQNQLALRQCQRKPLSYFAIQISLAMSNVVLTLALFYWLADNAVIERLMAITLSYVFTFVMAMQLARRQLRLRFRLTVYRLAKALRYILVLGLPLVLHALSYTIKGQFDRLLINQQFSSHDLGIYAAGVQIASSLSIVIMAVNSAAVPYLYERLKSGRITLSRLHRAFWASLLFAPVVTAIAWLIPTPVYTWLLGQAFAESRYYTLCFVFAFALAVPYLILVNFLFYHAKNAQISLCSVISTGVYLAVLWWASQISIRYVPFASVISTLVLLPLLYYYTLMVDKANLNKVRVNL